MKVILLMLFFGLSAEADLVTVQETGESYCISEALKRAEEKAVGSAFRHCGGQLPKFLGEFIVTSRSGDRSCWSGVDSQVTVEVEVSCPVRIIKEERCGCQITGCSYGRKCVLHWSTECPYICR